MLMAATQEVARNMEWVIYLEYKAGNRPELGSRGGCPDWTFATPAGPGCRPQSEPYAR